MGRNCGAALVKYLLCFFNFVLFVIGGAILALGIWIRVDNTSLFLLTRITDNVDLQYHNEPSVLEQGAYILIVLGALLFLLGFLGCCGAAMESRALLATYGVLIILLFLSEVTVGIMAGIYKQQIEDHLREFLKNTLRSHYRPQDTPNSITVSWNAIMMKMECCGVNNFTDFELATRWQENKTFGEVIPMACCKFEKSTRVLQDGGVIQEGEGHNTYNLKDESCLTDPDEHNSNYVTSCFERLKESLEVNAMTALGLLIGVGILELLLIVLAFTLCGLLSRETK